MNMLNKNCIRFHLPISINSTSKVILNKIDARSLKGFAGYIKQHYLMKIFVQFPHVLFVAETK